MNKKKKPSKGKSSVTDVLPIRVPIGLTKEERARARKVAQEAVKKWHEWLSENLLH
jgi:hypothetical protein